MGPRTFQGHRRTVYASFAAIIIRSKSGRLMDLSAEVENISSMSTVWATGTVSDEVHGAWYG